jgi:uncharacterized Ntn-hydrolase superfamily protein
MRHLGFAALLIFLVTHSAFATFSIVAIDPVTGDLGVAVASRVFGVGNHVPWAEAGVGAIATQASMNASYGPHGLELLKQGLTAQQVMDKLLAEDTLPNKEGRQFAIVDAKGNIAVHTGAGANDWKGHIKGQTFSVQGNILVGPQVVQAMANAFQETKGELAERLLAALKAGDDAGGDRRGRQSASILVVRKGGGSSLANDRLVYINVDDHVDPLYELARELPLQFAMSYGGKRGTLAREGKIKDAYELAEKLARWTPRNPTAHMHVGFLAYLTGNKTRSMEAFGKAHELNPNFKQDWDTILKGQDGAVYKKILDDNEFVTRVLQQ